MFLKLSPQEWSPTLVLALRHGVSPLRSDFPDVTLAFDRIFALRVRAPPPLSHA